MRVANRSVLTAFAVILILFSFAEIQRAEAYYYPPYNIPPGPPPNYSEIDTSYFVGTPVLPDPPPDSGGFYIWVDESGAWNIANHLYVRGNNIEHYHGSILAVMSSPPAPGVNVFATNFELTSSGSPSGCYRQNDRWGWYQWDENLYEIWWDVSTRESNGDENDFMKIRVMGCAIDFNLWCSGHDHGFGPTDIYLGGSMTRLYDISEYNDTYPGIEDQYDIQHDENRNISRFKGLEGSGQSYNKYGLITPSQTYDCGLIEGETYGARFSGAFVYEANGVQFSASCVHDPCENNKAPQLQGPYAYNAFQCSPTQYCFDVNYFDEDNNFHHFELLSGSGTIDSLTGLLCFTPAGKISGNSFTVMAIDSCGMADTAEYAVGLAFNEPPVAISPMNHSILACNLNQICIPGFTASDPNNNLASKTLSGGMLHGDTACFTPVAGANTLRLIATDSCGVADTAVTVVTVNLNHQPDATGPANQNRFACDFSEICVPGFAASDIDGNLASVILLGGTLRGDTACFTPIVGANTLKLIATDACGLTDTHTTVVTVVPNQAPVAVSPSDQSMLVCDLSQICKPGFTATDVDGNLVSKTLIGGTLHGDTACFTPVAGANTLKLIAVDACGAADTSITVITISVNQPPVAVSPANQNMFVCDLSQICIPGFTATDPDHNIVSKVVLGGSLSGETACFTPVSGPNTLTFIATDACGVADTAVTVVTVDLNDPPVATSPSNQNLFVCDLSQICIPGFIATDPDGNLSGTVLQGGVLHGDSACFTPTPGQNTLRLIATDACGAADTNVTIVTVALNSAPLATSPSNQNLFVCDLSQICLPGFTATDIDNNIVSRVVLGGTLGGETACFTPVMGPNTLTFIVTDACGRADTSVTVVTVALNRAPVAVAPVDQGMFVCNLDQICLPGFITTDPDNNIVSRVLQGGTLHGDTACFVPVAGPNTLRLIVTDACGQADTAGMVVTITLNQPPVAVTPSNQNMFVCDLSQVCLPGFTTSDPDGNLASTTLIGGTLQSDNACFTPVVGANTLTLIALDACGRADTSITVVTISLNSAPLAEVHTDTSYFLCAVAEICLPGFRGSDIDNNISTVTLLGGALHGDTACFTPVAGVNTLRLVVSDACGAADTSVANITVSLNGPPVASSPADTSILLPGLVTVCLPGFTGTDPNGNLVSKIVLGGTLSGDTVCFTPVAGINTLTLICTDVCGAADTSITHVTVSVAISLTIVGAPPAFTEEVADSFYIAVTGGDPGTMIFTSAFTAHAGTPGRFATSFASPNFKTVVTFDYLGEFSSAQSPFAYRVIATDANSADTLDLSLIVSDNNRIPTIASINDTTILVGSTLSFAVNGNDLDTDNTLTMSKISGPGSFVSIPGNPPVTGNFNWTPAVGNIGSHQVIFTVNDGRGGSAADTVNISVEPTGIILSILGGSPPDFIEEVPDSFFIALGGFDPGTLSFAASFPGHAGAPARYSTALVGGSIRITSTFDFLGEFSSAQSPFAFRIIASDNFSADTLDLSLMVLDNNRLPEITVGSNYTIIADHPLSFAVSAGDLDLDNTLVLSKFSGPGAFPGASGPSPVSSTFTWTPTDADVPGSPHTVRFAVADGRGGVDTANVTITVFPEGAPTINLVYSPTTFHEGRLDSIVFTASDPEGDALGGFGYRFLAPDSSFAGASFAVRNDTAYLRLTFDYVGIWSFASSPFPLRLLGYSMLADADSAYLNVSLVVLNTNRKPELTVTGPNTIDAGDTVTLDLSAVDPDIDDIITLSASGLPLGSIFSDFGDRSGQFRWITSPADTGMYSFRFFANDNRGQTNSRDTVNWSLQVVAPDTGSGPGTIGLDIGCPSAVPGSDVPVPVFLHTPDFYTGGFELLINWDPTVLTLLDAVPVARMRYGQEYFNVHNGDSGPGTARLVWIADINNGIHTSPINPGNGVIMILNFHVAPGEFLFGVSVPINFLVRDYTDNTISDSTGYILEWPLLNSGCVYIENPDTYEGDPNMNCSYYEIADAVLVAQRLIEGYIVWSTDDDWGPSPECGSSDTHYFGNDVVQEASSDLNANGFVDIADLVRFINIINGFVFPPKLDPVTGVGVVSMSPCTGPDIDIRVNSGYEIGGAIVTIDHGNVEIGEPIPAPGMDILSIDNDGILKVLIYSITGNRIPAGQRTLFTIPVSGDGALSFADVSLSDAYGRLLESTTRIETVLPTRFAVQQNYPNPFNAKTLINFDLPVQSDVTISIYNIAGQLVETINGNYEAGHQQVTWNASDVASGVYFAKVATGDNAQTVKMTMLK